MATVLSPSVPEERFILRDVRWQTYLALLADRGRGRYRITYDRGSLELMTISFRHESLGELFGRFLVILSEVLQLRIRSAGSTTLKREDESRGLEPDKCYYIQNANLVQDHDDIVLETDPPPDLAIEIDITRSSLNRMGIYAALRIPEVWRCDGNTVLAYHLQNDGAYITADHSRAFPMLPMQQLIDLVRQYPQTDEMTLGLQFRQWLRTQLGKEPSS